ncbi:UPF0280 family protein [Roseivivax isoporae]|uniref:ApbE family lipoprotein n=1 Tax=Roseivivax isoporae LMG 25204 TaxID=1449351 RepID=X7FES6_9RHOB|nr:UPF0280 family protein [Roseivivax isoporae]ETX30546.1 hypothetical protein RISW2_12830 [Roseivivax isoporae LMG 25204]
MRPAAALLPGDRLHLQHGPIDLVIGAEGDRRAAFAAARARFDTVLEELVAELPQLRRPVPSPTPEGETARRMHAACLPHADGITTPMAAVAGAVAETVLAAMVAAAPLRRAYVNNGGDIALHIAQGAEYAAGIAAPDGTSLGTARIAAGDPVRGIATSGQGGRSLSLGIADAVTVLAASAAAADVAATRIANAVDLAGHPAIRRAPAATLRDDSDLGQVAVVTAVGLLDPEDIAAALDRGARAADAMRRAGLIAAAALFLRGSTRSTGALAPQRLRRPEHA